MSYIDWEYYSSLYDNIPQESFKAYERKAAIKLNTHTHMRVANFCSEYDEATATDFEKQVHEQIQITMCELMNKMYNQEAHSLGEGITSVSNDGYSESYEIKTTSQKEGELLQVIRSGLSGTGLAGAI